MLNMVVPATNSNKLCSNKNSRSAINSGDYPENMSMRVTFSMRHIIYNPIIIGNYICLPNATHLLLMKGI